MSRRYRLLVVFGLDDGRERVANAQTYRSFDVPFAGARDTEAFGVNNLGQIVGRYMKGHTIHGFLRQPNGAFSEIFFGIDVHRPRDINNHGDVVGRYLDVAGVSHGFLLSHGGYQSFDYPGAANTLPRGISDSGVITGNFQLAGVEHGFILDATGYHQTDFPGSAGTDVWDFDSRRNEAVGDWSDADGNVHGYTLIGATFTPFDVSIAGAWATSLRSVNRFGVIVGVYAVDFVNDHGVLVTAGGQEVLLDFPGAPSTDVMAISDLGLIVGNYNDSHGNARFILR